MNKNQYELHPKNAVYKTSLKSCSLHDHCVREKGPIFKVFDERESQTIDWKHSKEYAHVLKGLSHK